jgi:O-antigen/teichoic acid export membrane protein
MLGYGLRYQGLGLLKLVYEPVTKSLLSAYGGLAMAGYFEMASQYVMKVRAFLVSAQQVLTPEVAERNERDPEGMVSLYTAANRLNWLLCVPVFGLTAASAPFIAHIWTGQYNPTFVSFVLLLTAGWFVNALSGPGFFLLLGTGHLRPLLASHTTTAIVNVAAGAAFGLAAGGFGVVAGWSLSLILGAVHLLVWLARHHGTPISVPKGVGRLVAAAVGAVAVSLAGAYAVPASVAVSFMTTVGAGGLLAAMLWHTAGSELYSKHRARPSTTEP